MQMHTPLLDLERAKKLAKQAKHSHPDLTHAQRLDVTAREHFAVRHYHELRKRASDAVAALCAGSGSGTVTCSLCGLQFAPDLAEDRITHEKRHLAFEEALVALGRLPAEYHEREQAKRDGRQMIEDAKTAEEELAGVERLLQGWFDRSLAAAIGGGYWKRHPTFGEYAAMVHHLVRPHLNLAKDLYLAKYGDMPGHIEQGQSYWYPPTR